MCWSSFGCAAILDRMSLGVALFAGILGAGAGFAAADFGLSVAPRRGLPRPTLRPSVKRRRVPIMLGAAAVSGITCTTVAVLPIPITLLFAYCLCGVVATALAIIDLRVRRLPYVLTGVMYGSCVVAFLVSTAMTGEVWPLVRALVAGSLAFLAFLALALALPGQLGLGDVVLVGWIALSLGWFAWRAVVVGLLVGLIVQATVALMFLVGSRPRRTLPVGPALLFGWLVGVVAAALWGWDVSS
jgi:hypothetical protein